MLLNLYNILCKQKYKMLPRIYKECTKMLVSIPLVDNTCSYQTLIGGAKYAHAEYRKSTFFLQK